MSDDNQLMDNFIEALENENNGTIMKLTSKKIDEHKIILNELQLKPSVKRFLNKLEDYRYCSEMGFRIWFIYSMDPITNPDEFL